MRFLTLTLTALVVFMGGTTQSQASGVVAQKCPRIVSGINFYRQATWKWQSEIGAHPTRSVFNAHRIVSCAYANWVGSLWRKRSHSWRMQYQKFKADQRAIFNRLYAKWECIHGYEGSWTANTGNGYYGGLQMDWNFMRHYGSKFLSKYGTADKWPVIDQLIAAERAYSSGRGYGPWPNTARYCGLI